MDIFTKLSELGLTPDNSVVIGSGILSALNIRNSEDIDVVVASDVYSKLKQSSRFVIGQTHGREILTNKIFEIGTNWAPLGESQTLDDLTKKSVVINGVRYITLEFLLDVKQGWLKDDDVRQKDIDDVKLIEPISYLRLPQTDK